MTMTELPSQPPAHATGASVRINNVRRVFEPEHVVALEKIDLDVPGGQFIAILGPSGCGKSTLLRIIAGLDRPTTGTVELTEAQKLGPSIAYVFQDAHLLPWRNVLRNVTLPLELRGVDRFHQMQAATDALSRVGLSDFQRRYPAQLSGGMRMRVSLARALVTNPRLLLLDEPFAALDEITRQQLDEQLRQLWRTHGMTVIFVTHSIVEAAFLAERAIVMSRRPGRVVLDHHLASVLPQQRTNALRGEAVFARQTRILFEALERGGM
jgi:NitT/TauT family transport system ATP-binding protein